MFRKIIPIFIIIIIGCLGFYLHDKSQIANHLPVVAIANYGPHSSLDNTIKGFKKRMRELGFEDGKNVKYVIQNVNFDPSLISQMLSSIKNEHPAVIVAMTTPIAQLAKARIHDIPIVFSVVTDPVVASLLNEPHKSNGNITGTSDKQDLNALLSFAKSILPHAKTVGLLYSTAEINDRALVEMMTEATKKQNMNVLAIPVDQPRDIKVRMQQFKDKVDFIYVGTSGPIQPSLPIIAKESRNLKIPVFNVDEQSVIERMALASFGVNYLKIGANTANIVAAILHHTDIAKIHPLYPSFDDHKGFVNKTVANEFGITIPLKIERTTIVE